MKKSTSKLGRFLQNNIALLVIVLCMVAISTIVLVVALTENQPVVDTPVVGGNNNNDDNNDEDKDVDEDKTPTTPTVTEIQVFYTSPVANSTVGMQFTDSDLLFVFNQTLNSWKTHSGLDLCTTGAEPVVAMLSGTVIDVNETFELGQSVVVDHGNGVIATYASLADIEVIKGQTLAQGDKLGVTSVTANNEYLEGNHLHLEVSVDGEKVDPTPYVNGEKYVTEKVVIS